MSRPVFISYARSSNAAHAQALAECLGELAFFDTDAIEDGDRFPEHLLEGVLGARVVVIFASEVYCQRRFCQLEMYLALYCGPSAPSHLVVALGNGSGAVLDVMPGQVAGTSWPAADDTERLDALVRRVLANNPTSLGDSITPDEARGLAKKFLEQSKVPAPVPLRDVTCSLPAGVAGQSIGTRFVGRSDDIRRVHNILTGGGSGDARLTGRITAAAGFGKSRLAAEYVHRYGAQYYPGGIFWVDATSPDRDLEFWRVLSSIEPSLPDIAVMRAQGRDVRRELERALRFIGKPVLYVVDNIDEAIPGQGPPSITDFCPALGAVTVLITSRQDTYEQNMSNIALGTLERDSAILLLTENVPYANALTWSDWGRIAEWVGDLPIALDLLNRSLVLNAISPKGLLDRTESSQPSSPTRELDRLRESLRGQIPEKAVFGITEAFSISVDKLDKISRRAGMVIAQLASAPVPEDFFDALPAKLGSPAVRACLRSRHFVSDGGTSNKGIRVFGVMHRLTADFLRILAAKSAPGSPEIACNALQKLMTRERCDDARQWPLMNLYRPHAEVLFERFSTGSIPRNKLRFLPTTVVVYLTMLYQAGRLAMKSSVLCMNAGGLALAEGDLAASRQLGERALDSISRTLGEQNPGTWLAMGNLAVTLQAQGDLARARPLAEVVLKGLSRTWGGEHPLTLTAMNILSEALREQGNFAEAKGLQEQVLRTRTRLLGEGHPSTLKSMSNLALSLSAQGDQNGARQLQERVLEGRARLLGTDHPDTLDAMLLLSATLKEQGDGTRALQLAEDAVMAMKKSELGEKHPRTLKATLHLAVTLWNEGDRSRARELAERALNAMKEQRGADHPDTLDAMLCLAKMLQAQGEGTMALQLADDAVTAMKRVLGEEHRDTLNSMGIFVFILSDAGQVERALALGRACMSGLKKTVEDNPRNVAGIARIADLLTHLEEKRIESVEPSS
jgi:tetratricopeptide (TPR) repeat protein